MQASLKFNDSYLDEDYRDLLGGVVLSCLHGRIKCANTLDMRIGMVFEESLPDMREVLFA